MKNSHEDKGYLSHSLKQMDSQMEWTRIRKGQLGAKLVQQITRENKKQRKRLWVAPTLSFSFAAFALIFIATILSSSITTNQDSNSPILQEGIHFNYEKNHNNQREPVLTEQGREQSVYPLDADQTIDTIIGEPNITLAITNIDGKQQIESQAFYLTTTAGRMISVHTQSHSQPINQWVEAFLPHKHFPSKSYTAYEVDIAGQHGVIQLNNDVNHGSSERLTVITDKNIYYFYSSGTFYPEEMIRLAEMFDYENEW
ncbi:hypothetical protein [Cytobacillus purgationiresistens]|uniref:DUF4367 domain-containing protein n=1 Tax=Cytobacillus purgationiresistens TaxID=863449 RepID=A0ABU0AAP1_9BACI|nr:hypothetical protein [Cytobacillus purgationiresistens]MDQ0268321.1 hypothetical protein [Cytobacillus purgationiresistens]